MTAVIVNVVASASAESLSLLLSVVSGVLTAVSAAVASGQLRERLQQRRVLTAIAAEDKARGIGRMDLQSLQTYLFDTLGSMSIHEYARDLDAQRFVARAVDRVEEFLEEGKRVGTDTPQADHLTMAADAIQHGDLIAGLARLRLAIELRLRDLALEAGLPAERAAGGRLVEMLRRANILDAQTSDALAYAVRVGNRAVHGEAIEASQAQEALYLTGRALSALGGDPGEPRSAT